MFTILFLSSLKLALVWQVVCTDEWSDVRVAAFKIASRCSKTNNEASFLSRKLPCIFYSSSLNEMVGDEKKQGRCCEAESRGEHTESYISFGHAKDPLPVRNNFAPAEHEQPTDITLPLARFIAFRKRLWPLMSSYSRSMKYIAIAYVASENEKKSRSG